MNSLKASSAGIALGLLAGLLGGCGGGGYGGGGNNPPASLNMTIDPDTITLGESATITWNTNGNSCTASGAWSGMKGGSGTETVTPTETGTLTYSLQCRGGGYGNSDRASATLTVNPAQVSALFAGEACCVDAESIDVTLLAADSGEFRLLARGMQVIGEAGKRPVAFGAGDSLAGARLADARALKALALTTQGMARGTILVKDRAAASRRLDFALPRDRSFDRRASLGSLAGIYTTSLASGYAFTLTIDRSGEVFGSDSRGCMVRGVATTPRTGQALPRVALSVSACGSSNGRYQGSVAPVGGSAARPAGLFLSASNEDSAIGWRLAR